MGELRRVYGDDGSFQLHFLDTYYDAICYTAAPGRPRIRAATTTTTGDGGAPPPRPHRLKITNLPNDFTTDRLAGEVFAHVPEATNGATAMLLSQANHQQQQQQQQATKH